jgi:hypothetical protein
MSKIQQTQQTHAQTAAKANKPQQAQHKSFNPVQMLESPESMRSEDVLAAQQTVGNQVVQRALDKDDRRKGLTDNQGNLRQDLNEQIQQKRGGGSPLPENIQKEASKKLGHNFKEVRIHTDESADKLSRTISARAFTIGKDIFFKNGVFAPGSSAGRETIIHELTHVVQQGGRSGASGALKLGAPDTAHEKEADRIGKKHAASISAAPAGAVQREGEEDELMMQEDEEELMMQQDEEELQMQPAEEDELQMQADVSGVVQRHETGEPHTHDEDEQQKKKPVVPPLNLSKVKKSPVVPPLDLSKAKKSPVVPPLDLSKAKKSPVVPPLDLSKAKKSPVVPPLDLSKAKKSPNIGELPQGPSKDPKEGVDKLAAALDPKGAAKEAKNAAKKARAEEKALDKRFAQAAKDPKKFNEMEKQAKEKAEAKAQKDTASQGQAKSQMDAKSQEDTSKAKPESKGKKFGKAIGSGLLSAGKWAGGKALGYTKSKLDEGINHFLGIKEDDDDEKKTTVNVNLNKGGETAGKSSGGKSEGGGKSVAEETIAELYQKNKKLKAQVKQLEEAAAARAQG